MNIQLLQDFLLAPTLFSLAGLLMTYIIKRFKPKSTINIPLITTCMLYFFISNALLYVDITIQLRG